MPKKNKKVKAFSGGKRKRRYGDPPVPPQPRLLAKKRLKKER